MASLWIHGGRPLRGRVRAAGRKNSAVAVLPATLLSDEPTRIDNLPDIADVVTMIDLIRAVGASVDVVGPGSVVVTPGSLHPNAAPRELAQRMRASYYLLSILLARCGEADVPFPGGCAIGSRPIDQHLKGFRALGAEVDVVGGAVRARAVALHGAHVYLDVTSVGATINLMLLASQAEGTTVIENAAKEPHVVDVATLLLAMGASIVGAGTDIIKVRGRERLHGCQHAIIPDEIEAATFMIAAAGTTGEVIVENVIPRHLEAVSAKLVEAGCQVDEDGEAVRVTARDRPLPVRLKTQPYPGFPTDAQQPMTSMLTIANGTSTVTENVWEDRFRFTEELRRMGAVIEVDGRTATVRGVPRLSGTCVQASDLRAGAALVVAGLIAEGVSEVQGIEHLDRGYEQIAGKLQALGARIDRRVEPFEVAAGADAE